MTYEEGVVELLARERGARVEVEMEDGELVVLRRTHNGIQALFPSRVRREPTLGPISRQQDELGISS